MNKNSSNIIKEVLLAFAMGIIFLAVLIALSYIIFPNQMTEGENTEELLLKSYSFFFDSQTKLISHKCIIT